MFVMSASAKPATTSSSRRLVIVTNAELDEEEGELEDVAAVPEAAPPDEALEDELPLLGLDALLLPETDSPTEPSSAVTVPATGEVSVVSLSAFSSSLTVWVSWATWASSCEIVDGLVVEFAAMVAFVDARLASACSTVSCCRWSVCLSFVMALLSCVQLFTELDVEEVGGVVVVVVEPVEPDEVPDAVLPELPRCRSHSMRCYLTMSSALR